MHDLGVSFGGKTDHIGKTYGHYVEPLTSQRATVDALLSRLRIDGRLYTTSKWFGGILLTWAYLTAHKLKPPFHPRQK